VKKQVKPAGEKKRRRRRAGEWKPPKLKRFPIFVSQQLPVVSLDANYGVEEDGVTRIWGRTPAGLAEKDRFQRDGLLYAGALGQALALFGGFAEQRLTRNRGHPLDAGSVMATYYHPELPDSLSVYIESDPRKTAIPRPDGVIILACRRTNRAGGQPERIHVLNPALSSRELAQVLLLLVGLKKARDLEDQPRPEARGALCPVPLFAEEPGGSAPLSQSGAGREVVVRVWLLGAYRQCMLLRRGGTSVEVACIDDHPRLALSYWGRRIAQPLARVHPDDQALCALPGAERVVGQAPGASRGNRVGRRPVELAPVVGDRPERSARKKEREHPSMHFVTTQSALFHLLAQLSRAVKETTDLPILSHVLLQAAAGRVSLSANNLEIGITCDLATTGTVEDGAVAVPYARLRDLVERLPTGLNARRRKVGDTTIELEAPEDSSTLTVSSGRSRAVIYGMHASEFPVVPGPGSDAHRSGLCLSLPCGLLAGMVRKVAFAAATSDKPNPILIGVLLHASGQSLTFTARDAYRLAACTASLEEAPPRECAVVIPAVTAAECARVLASARPQQPVQLVIEEQRAQVSFLLPGLLLATRLLPGEYPMGFKTHVKPGYLTRVVVGTKGLAAALGPLAQLARDDGDLVALSFATSAGGKAVVTLGARSQDLGEQAEETDAVSLEGDAAGGQLLLKYSQLEQVVAVLGAPYLALELRGSANPLAVRPVGGDETVQETYVLVPCTRKT
jgi:DNA polymerase-3 subunit beta